MKKLFVCIVFSVSLDLKILEKLLFCKEKIILFLKIQKTLRVTYISEIYLGTINFNLINNEYLKTLLPKKHLPRKSTHSYQKKTPKRQFKFVFSTCQEILTLHNNKVGKKNVHCTIKECEYEHEHVEHKNVHIHELKGQCHEKSC